MIDWQTKVVAPCVAVFGQPATITQGGTTYTLNGVFDEAYAEVDASDGMPVTTVKPCLGFNVADMNLAGQPVSVLQGARVTIAASTFAGAAPAANTTYIVKEVRVDGHGWGRLMLNLAPVAADEPAGGGQDA